MLICENDKVMRDALADLIASLPSLELAGATGDPDEAAELGASTPFDAALLDVRMPRGGGPRAARLLRALNPEARIVAFSAHADRPVVIEMLLAGADEYLIKGMDDVSIADALQRSGRGHIGLPPAELEEMVFDLAERVNAGAPVGAERVQPDGAAPAAAPVAAPEPVT